MNKKYLITVGCSYTIGTLDQKPWPYYLAKLMDRELINKADGGKGNYYISNQVYSTVADSKYNSSNTKVVIMWSGVDRRDSYYEGEWISLTYEKSYLKYHTIMDSYLQTLQHMIGVQEVLTNRKIPYLFLTYRNIFDLDKDDVGYRYRWCSFPLGWNKSSVSNTDIPLIKQTSKLIDWNKFHFHKSTFGMDEWVKDNNLGIGNDKHPKEVSHKEYVEYLHNLNLI